MPTSLVSDEQASEAAGASVGPGGETASDEPAEPQADVVAELAAVKDELASTQDRYRRSLADLDNYRKRTARDGDRRAAEARQAVLREWLEAVDTVERALRLDPGDAGLSAVLGQMDGILTRAGVLRMQPVGAAFDPQRQEAIEVRVTDDEPDYTVLDVARSGYELADTVLRPAQVVVSRRPASEA